MVPALTPELRIVLDESAITFCRQHTALASCKQGCEQRTIFAVGACVVEDNDAYLRDEAAMETLRQTLAYSNGVSGTNHMERLLTRGWHATEDIPELTQGFVSFIDARLTAKFHVRYVEGPAGVAPAEIHKRLFAHLLSDLAARYPHAAARCDFEENEALNRSFEPLVAQASVRCSANWSAGVMKKGEDHHLAAVDYFLYAFVKYYEGHRRGCRAECLPPACFSAPIAAKLLLDEQGNYRAMNHLENTDRWHKRLLSFVPRTSSAACVPSALLPLRPDVT